ncbi:MAG: hypothetical protein R3E32_22335 [Chitinophagales bacterium]
MTTSKTTLLLSLLLVSFCSFAQSQNQNQKLYWGFSTGFGGVSTTIDKEVNFSDKIGFAIPTEANLSYHLSDAWALQLSVGFHAKHYRVSADKFYTNDFPIRPQANFSEWQPNLTTGLNVIFRQPFNAQKKMYWGMMTGYGINWKNEGWGGRSLSRKNCDNIISLPPFSFDPSGCERALEVNYDFSNQGSQYYLFGLLTDFVLPSQKTDKSNILRLAVVNRTGRGLPMPLTGNILFYEEGEPVEDFDFRSNGSMLSFEIGWLMAI